jgi:hypothetical protein
MRGQAEITIPEIARVIATRLALGTALGLLLANRMTKSERRAVGATLLLCGTVSAGVMALELFGRPRPMTLSFGQPRENTGPSESRERFAQRSSTV